MRLPAPAKKSAQYGLTVEAIRGVNSTTNIYTAAQPLGGLQLDGKTVTILYLGDWDPSGKDIERDLILRLGQSGLAADIVDAAGDIDVQRIAIFREDIAEFKLPPFAGEG
jgi:hypothetical protein